MRCETHCPAPVSRLPLAVAVVVLAAVVPAAAVLVGHVLLAVLVAVLGADAAGVWAVCRLVRYGALRRPRRVVVAAPVALVRVQALPAPPRAIEPARPVVQGVVIEASEKVGRWAGQ